MNKYITEAVESLNEVTVYPFKKEVSDKINEKLKERAKLIKSLKFCVNPYKERRYS